MKWDQFNGYEVLVIGPIVQNVHEVIQNARSHVH